MKVGFTGTRDGMTECQRMTVQDLLAGLEPTEFHHGDCLGSDAEAHDISVSLGIPVVIHPPRESVARAFCQGYYSIRSPQEYLDRDRDIVLATGLLIATPKTRDEVRRSGTWFTVRHARKLERIIHIVNPDGEIRIEGMGKNV